MSLFNTDLGSVSDSSSVLPDEPESEPNNAAEQTSALHVDYPVPGESALDATEPENGSSPFDDSDYDDLSDTESNRPNRWHGTADKLRGLTSQERHTLAALDALDDDDLSLHLYNVHGLKRGLYPDYANDSDASKYEQWMKKERLLEGDQWYPHRSWTAWPLEPGLVPRGDERMLWAKERLGDAEARRADLAHRIKMKPSHDLEELLLAEFTKQARRKYEAREWATDSEADDEDEIDRRIRAGSLKRSASAPSTKLERNSKAPRTVRHDSVGPTTGRSQTPVKNEALEHILRPTLITDDDQARMIAQPCINNIIHNVDNLLLALHHSRQHQTTSVRRDQEDQDDNERAVAQTSSESDTEASDVEGAPRRRRRLQMRDWSEVLAMAAAAGWDRKALRRAQERCQALFEEQMTFRDDLDTGPYDTLNVDSGASKGRYAKDEEMLGGVHVDGFMQPLKRYPSKRAQKSRADTKRPPSGVARASRSSKPSNTLKCLDCGTISRKKFAIRAVTDSLCNGCRAFLHRTGRHRQIDAGEEGSSQQRSEPTKRTKSCHNCGRRPSRQNKVKLKRGPDGPNTLCAICYMDWYRSRTSPGRDLDGSAVEKAGADGQSSYEENQ